MGKKYNVQFMRKLEQDGPYPFRLSRIQYLPFNNFSPPACRKDYVYTATMEMLICEICHDPFDDIEKIPKLLTCGHTFWYILLLLPLMIFFFSTACVGDDGQIIHCARCGENSLHAKPNYDVLRFLKKISLHSQASEMLMSPNFPKPDASLAVLTVPKCEFCEENDAYAYCENCTKLKYLCDECFAIRHKKSPFDKHRRIPWKAQYSSPLCAVHNQECLIFCKTDTKPICTLCSYGEHVGHDTCLIENEIVNTHNRIQKVLHELESKSRHLRAISLEANRTYISLNGNSLLDSNKEHDIGTISQVIQEIHSHFYALRHMLQQKEDELIRLVKEKSQEKLVKLAKQVDDTALFIARSYILDQHVHQFLLEMPHYWVLQNEQSIIQHIENLANNNHDTELLLCDHVVASPEIFFRSGDAQKFLDSYQVTSSDDILLIEPLSNLQSTTDYYIPNDDGVCDKINDFLSDPVFSSIPDSSKDLLTTSKYFSIAEEEPYICYPGVTKHLTLCSINIYNEKIIVGGGGGALFRCTLEKQEVGPRATSRKLSSRRSITPPHFRHTSTSPLSHGSRSSTPPPSNRTKWNHSGSIPRTSSGSSLHSFCSHSTLSTPKKDTYGSFSSLSPRNVIENPSADSEDVNIIDNNDGTYTLEIVTKQQGLYRLNITLSGDHVKGSPYFLHSEYHTSVIGSKGSTSGYFSSPYGVHYDQVSQQLLISDSSNNRIQIFSSDGEFLHSFGTHGRSTGQFSWPLGLCVCRQRIYVCDNMNNRVQIFSMDGSYIKSIGINNKQQGQLLTPYDICSNDDMIFIADTGNKRIQVNLGIFSSLFTDLQS